MLHTAICARVSSEEETPWPNHPSRSAPAGGAEGVARASSAY
ncbi:MAG: hypothetical protein WC233_07495 [Sphaerochaeta sp.]